MQRIAIRLLFLSLCFAAVAPAADFDWPQWQGPERNAISSESGLMKEWPADGPKLLWRMDTLGGGYSAPAVADGRMYGMSNRGEDEVVWSLSEENGEEVWATSLGPACKEGGSQANEGPDCTPTVDGDRLYVIGAGGTLACLQVSDGKVVWKRDFVKDFGGVMPRWRYSESPLIDGDKVICTPGADEATMLALDKTTGDVIWQTKVPDGAGSGQASQRRGPSMIQRDPVLKALDVDGNEKISAEEINGAAAAIATLDKDADGKLSEEEVTAASTGAERGGRRSRRFSATNMPVNKALDADENKEIDGSELKNAVAVLKKLDKNSDNELTDDEVSPQFGRGGPSSGAAYSSPIAIDFEGQRQYVQLTAKTLVGVDASNGKVLWRYDRPANGMRINCSTPIYQDGMVFASSAYGNGGGAVKLTKEPSGEIKADEVYFTSDMQNHHGGMIVIGGCLYGANGGNGGGFLSCLDFETGKVLWRDRDAKKGSLTFADDRLYLYTEDGTLMLIEPNKEELVERGRFEQPDRSDSPAWTHPVIANGKLYVRDQGLLLCYELKP